MTRTRFSACSPSATCSGDAAAVGGVERVVEQVRDRLRHAQRVDVDGPHARLQLDGELVGDGDGAAAARLLLRLREDLGRRRRLAVQLHLAALDLGGVEDLGEQAQQVEAGGVHRGEHDALAGRDLAFEAAQEQLGEAEDRVERRAQIVAHVGEELRLQAARFVGALDGEERLDGEARDALEQAIDRHGHAAHLGRGDGAERLRLLAVGDARDLLGDAARVVARRRRRASTRPRAPARGGASVTAMSAAGEIRRGRVVDAQRAAARAAPPSARST